MAIIMMGVSRRSVTEMIILAVLVTIILGYLGAVVGHEFMNGFSELGTILAVASMGAFIMIDKKGKDR